MALNGQVILITGAGGGLGGTAAVALAKQGATIILLDNKIPKLEVVYDRIKAVNALKPIMYPFDLAGANENEFQELANTIENKFGSLQGLLHSAVEFSGFRPMVTQTSQDWWQTLTVNLHAPMLLTRVLLPVLQKSENASIVFTTDSSVRNGAAYSGAYGVSKFGLEGFAKILAAELEFFNKIRVNTLIPGPVDSPARRNAFPAEDKSQIAKPAILEPVYQFLFGAESIGITGQCIDARTYFEAQQTWQKEKVSP